MLMIGINFMVIILKMRIKGMILMCMLMFIWIILIIMVIIVFVFFVLIVVLVFLLFDCLFGVYFFILEVGGMLMFWVNLFWIWGYFEVYIVIFLVFGIFFEIILSFVRK